MRKTASLKPTTEWVPISSLSFDPTVNTRPPTRSKVRSIAGSYDPNGFGIIEVSERPDGSRIILDGQNRIGARHKLGHTNGQLVECKVHRGLSHAEECRLFRLLNDETPVAPIYKMLAAIGEGHEPDASIAEIVQSVGLGIAGHADDGTICSAKALRNVYGGARFAKTTQEPHPELLRATLRTILKAWGKNKNGLRGDIIEGLGAFLARYAKQVDHDALVSRLAQQSPLTIVGEARSLRSVHGWQMSGAVAARIVMLYNTGRRSKKLTDWWVS